MHDDAGLPGRVQTALSIAKAFGAPLHLLHVTPLDAYTVVDAMGTYVNEGLVEMLESEAAKVEASLEEQLAKEDVSWDYEEVAGALVTHLMERAALADLILTGRSRTNGIWRSGDRVAWDLLRRTGTPLFVVGDGAHEGRSFRAGNGGVERHS